MNCLVVICALAVGVSALPSPQFGGVVGPSGMVRPDGRNVQFTQSQADNIVLVGPSGIVTKDGKNIQLNEDNDFVLRSKRSTAGYVTPKGNIGYSGILRADGSTDLFDHDTAHSILLIGPSGIVTKDGRNMQLTDDLRIVGRSKRSTGFTTSKGSVGYSGILRADGSLDQFDHDTAHNIVLIGASGIVTKDGRNMQLTDDLRIVGRSKRSAGFTTSKGSVGYSGILRADGSVDQFDHDTAHNIVLIGASGIVTKDGRNMQLTDDLRIVGRSKRSSAGYVTPKGNIGYSGILRADGTTDLFDHDTAHSILLIGPSGIVTKDGRNMQLTDDLRIVHRNKRHLIGDSGMITKDGTPVQFSRAGVEILLEGPSGIILSDGQLVQKKS